MSVTLFARWCELVRPDRIILHETGLKRSLALRQWGKSPKRTFATKKGETFIGSDNLRVAWTYDSLASRHVLHQRPGAWS